MILRIRRCRHSTSYREFHLQAGGGIGTDFEWCPARLGAPRRTKDQWKVHVVGINSRLKSLKVGNRILSGRRAQKSYFSNAVVRDPRHHR